MLAGAIVAAGLCLLGAKLVQIGSADLLADRDPVRALQHIDWQREAQTRRMQALADQPDTLPLAAEHAQAMLARYPLAGAPYTVLARQAAAAGDGELAERLMQIAVRRDPRQRYSHAWLADRMVMRGDFAGALYHFDQILRLSPRQLHTLMPALLSVAKHPGGRAAMTDWLGTHAPEWRDRFLTAWAVQAPSEQQLDEMFDALRGSDHPLTANERSQWVTRLVAQGRVAKAHYLWIDGLPEEQRTRVGNVFDGGFELPPSDGGFGWRIGRVPGAIIRLQSGGGVEGQNALVVEFQNRRVPFNHVRQLLALPPGDYRLIGRARLDDLRSERGLKWIVACSNGATPLIESEKFSGRRVWTHFSAEFTVPDGGCPAQWLELRIDARSAAEQWVGGRAWFDSLRIARR